MKDPVFGNTSVTAPNSITLSAGFTTISGSVFTASIGPVQTTGGAAVISSPSASATPAAGTTGQNYVKAITYREAPADGATSFKHNETIQYFDGLGRPMQTVSVGASPSGNDIIQPTLYDSYGREAIKTLPYTDTKSGEFRTGVTEATVNSYYGASAHPAGIITSSPERAYTQIGYEASPLNRVLTQTGPGANWASKPAAFNYLTNTIEKPGWTVTGDYTYSSFSYPISSLYVTESIDEQGTTTREYKDKQGQVVLKESLLDGNWLGTAYIYDDFGLLRCVMPPEANDPNTDTQLCYYYKYDSRNRMIEKKIPGGGTTTMLYDSRDRLRFTQDNNQFLNRDWNFIKYDALNRPVITGVLKNYFSSTPIQDDINWSTLNESWDNTNASNFGYTNQSFPFNGKEILTVTYYDNYDFLSISGLTISDSLRSQPYNTAPYDFATKIVVTPKGRVTGSMTKVLSADADAAAVPKNTVYAATYYDKYGHVLRSISDNHLGGKDIVSNLYEDITYQIQKSKQEHYKGTENIKLEKAFEYDHTGRLLATNLQVNGQSPITMNAMKYNEVGELVTKYLHSDQTSGSRNFIQKVDYNYNIRGWLTQINDPSLGSDNDLFGMKLFYEDFSGMGGLTPDPEEGLFNGNILGIKWNTKNDGIRGYNFYYDNLNRLMYARYAEGDNLDEKVDYNSESILNYDKNGNIMGLQRKLNNIAVDDLYYEYFPSSNQIKHIRDAGTQTSAIDDFPGTSGYYTYDANGNMIHDGSRNMDIDYHPTLNLPQYVDFGNNNLIYYSYTASGNKLVKHVQSGNGSTHNYTHYIGNIVYENGKLSYITTEEGRIVAIGDGADRRFINEYALKDHLGNTRVSFMGTSLGGAVDVVQTTNYYPFGLVMNQSNTNTDPSYSKNKYLYNGKELQNETLNGAFFGMLDYGARFYDPQIARWTTIDPLAEKSRRWSPYAYCMDNPIYFIDPDGMWPWPSWSDVKKFASGFVSTVKSAAEGAQLHNQIIGQVVLAKNVGTSLIKGDFKGAGKQLLNSTGIPAAVNTVKAAASGDPKALGNVAGAVAVMAVIHKASGTSTASTTATAETASTVTRTTEATANTRASTLEPGPYASESIPARGKETNFTQAERNQINEIGQTDGCHTCGTTEPGTKSGNFVPDHQPPSALVPDGTPQLLYPQCLTCSKSQGGTISYILKNQGQ